MRPLYLLLSEERAVTATGVITISGIIDCLRVSAFPYPVHLWISFGIEVLSDDEGRDAIVTITDPDGARNTTTMRIDRAVPAADLATLVSHSGRELSFHASGPGDYEFSLEVEDQLLTYPLRIVRLAHPA